MTLAGGQRARRHVDLSEPMAHVVKMLKSSVQAVHRFQHSAGDSKDPGTVPVLKEGHGSRILLALVLLEAELVLILRLQ
eukprot:9505959-Heterocapsa_arctica.AAC.1